MSREAAANVARFALSIVHAIDIEADEAELTRLIESATETERALALLYLATALHADASKNARAMGVPVAVLLAEARADTDRYEAGT